jgi:hypothetical protein
MLGESTSSGKRTYCQTQLVPDGSPSCQMGLHDRAVSKMGAETVATRSEHGGGSKPPGPTTKGGVENTGGARASERAAQPAFMSLHLDRLSTWCR